MRGRRNPLIHQAAASINLDERVRRRDDPLMTIRGDVADDVLDSMSGDFRPDVLEDRTGLGANADRHQKSLLLIPMRDSMRKGEGLLPGARLQPALPLVHCPRTLMEPIGDGTVFSKNFRRLTEAQRGDEAVRGGGVRCRPSWRCWQMITSAWTGH